MCSVNDAGDIEDLSSTIAVSKLTVKILPDKCNKCKERNPHILLRNKDAYCKDCFLASTNHKFRALLGKHRIIKDDDRVLIYYVGGHPTTALLNFLRTGLELNTPKKIRFIPVCLFLQNQFNLPKDDRLKILNDIVDEVGKFNIPIFFSSLVKFYENGNNIAIYENVEDFLTDMESIKGEKVFDTTETLTNDLEKIYERRLLISAAKKLNCNFIFSPEISTDIASQILSDVAIGRGSHIPSTTGFCDTRDEEIKVLRPLRVFDIKELALYNYYHNLDPVILSTKPAKSSIQNLIKNFVDQLQLSFPATVNTILRTGDKLSMATNKKKTAVICHICQSPIEAPFQSLTSKKAVEFSSRISKTKQPFSMVNDEVNKEICFSCSNLEKFL